MRLDHLLSMEKELSENLREYKITLRGESFLREHKLFPVTETFRSLSKRYASEAEPHSLDFSFESTNVLSICKL